MATQTVEFRSPPSQTVTAKLFAIGSDTQVASVTATEATNRKGTYSAAYTDIAAGEYELIALVGATPVARWFVTLTLTTATFQTYDKVLAALDSADKATLVDLIWDEPLTGATHNVATSSGKRLRQTTAFQQIDSTVIDASATTTTFVTGLTSSVDNFYNDSMLVFTDGALAGQVRAISDYIGATKTIVLEEALTSAPVNGVAFAIVSLHIHPVSQIQAGLATSATALSTTQWTNTLATNLGTTNTTVATNLNATVSSRSTQTSVDTIDDLLDTEIAAIKTKTDQLTFTTANKVDSTAVLDSATALKINRIEAVATGTVTGAGTSTEVFVGPSATLTITVDSSGNRSAVVVT